MEDKAKLMEDKIDNLVKLVLDINDNVIEATKKIDDNFEILDQKIDRIQKQVDGLHVQSTNGFESVNSSLSDVQQELKKIQKVSNYDDIYKNLLNVVK